MIDGALAIPPIPHPHGFVACRCWCYRCSTETTSNPDGPTLVSQRRAVREPLLAITLQCLAADTSALAVRPTAVADGM